jgi:hypothetical protein
MLLIMVFLIVGKFYVTGDTFSSNDQEKRSSIRYGGDFWVGCDKSDAGWVAGTAGSGTGSDWPEAHVTFGAIVPPMTQARAWPALLAPRRAAQPPYGLGRPYDSGLAQRFPPARSSGWSYGPGDHCGWGAGRRPGQGRGRWGRGLGGAVLGGGSGAV